MKIEFYWSLDPRTKSQRLQLLDSDLMVIATLDYRDFVEMGKQRKSAGILQDVVDYCNLCKGTSIKEFTPTVFDPCPLD